MKNLNFRSRVVFFNIYFFLFLCLPTMIMAQNDSTSGGEVFQELPTLHCLGVRWSILGDNNKNVVINVSYRENGSQFWLMGFPLMRTMPNPHSENQSAIHTVKDGWKFAGSIFGLKPDTEYEVRLNLEDPDGAKIEKKLIMKTWKEPMAPANMIIKYVSPGKGGGDGTKNTPYLGTQEVIKHLKPGTIFLFQKGKYDRFVIRTSGTIEKPIIFRGDGNGEAILEGGGDSRTKGLLVDFDDQKHIWFEDLIFQGMYQAMNGDRASNLLVRRCKFRKIEKCIEATNGNYETSQHFFITDNEFIGDATWPRTKGIESLSLTYISGGGHVIAYNRISNFG